jgi:lysophospholipase L1-like esterase
MASQKPVRVEAARRGEALPPAVGRIPLTRRLAYFSVPFLCFFVALAVAELACRFTAPRLSALEVFVREPEQKQGFTDRYQVSVFDGDPLLFWRMKPNLHDVIWDFTRFSTNSAGLRYPRDVGPKPANGFRIACFGDSVTFGYRVPTVWPERPTEYDRNWIPFHEILERALGHANPGRTIEVIPYAMPGYSSHQGLAFAGQELPHLGADVVIVLFGWNDINLRAGTDRESMDTGPKQVLLRRLTMKSQLLLRASMWWQARHVPVAPQPSRGPVERVPGPEFVENIGRIVDLAKQTGATPLVVGPVYRDPVTEPGEAERIGKHRALLREAMTAAGVPYVEIAALTESAWPGNGPLFGERIHPSDSGHRLMASVLLEFMASRGMLKDLRVPVAR